VWFRVGVAGCVVAALAAGGLGGDAWARHDERQRRAEADKTVVAVDAVVTPGISPSPPRKVGNDVEQRVDLAVISAGPATLGDVVVKWDPVHEAYSPGESGQSALGDLGPQDPRRVQLTLRQPCTAPQLAGASDVPRLVVTTRTEDGRRREVTVDPIGLDQTWTTMTATCPSTDPTTLTSVTLASARAVGDRVSDFTLVFNNRSGDDVLITGVILARGFNTSQPQQPDPLQVFPEFSARLVVRLIITDCPSMFRDITLPSIRYVVASADHPSDLRPMVAHPPKFATEVGQLFQRACGRP
jgi:hypothetical protein